ncbi:MAG: hypothetical protein ACRDOO_03845 [Actinomadura sp.]
MNRRGNGLSADAYAPLIDLTPELADAMLTALREAGIAAYASAMAETADEQDADEPLDRLYVDTSMRSTAESLLHSRLPRLREEPGPESDTVDSPDITDTVDIDTLDAGEQTRAPAERDDEAVWAEIVASFEAPSADGATPWPDEENIDDTGRDEGQDGGENQDRTGRLPTARVIKPADPAEVPATGDPADEDHYIPPPPPPLPDGDMVSRSAWAALLGGPLYLLVTVLLSWEVPGWAAFVAVAAFIGGFVTLVLRMGDDPRGPDDGAVV